MSLCLRRQSSYLSRQTPNGLGENKGDPALTVISNALRFGDHLLDRAELKSDSGDATVRLFSAWEAKSRSFPDRDRSS